jgi:CBS domain-containing protein
MKKIRDIMETIPYICPQTATVKEVIQQLADVQVGSLPIVNEENRLVGYISDSDIIGYIAHEKPKLFDWGEMIFLTVDDDPLEEKVRDLLEVPVMNIANKKKIFAEVDQDLDEVADLFKKHNIRKIAVLEDDKVIGVVTRTTILRYILTLMLPDE